MAKIYARWIIAGRITIDDVPAKWKEEVNNLLGALGNSRSD